MRRALLLAAAFSVALGCASAPVSSSIDLSGANGGVLLVVHVANAYKPTFQPTSLELSLVPDEVPRRPASFGEDVLAPYRHKVPRVQHEAERYSRFVFLMPVSPGIYQLRDVRGSATKFPLSGGFTLPIAGRVAIQAGRLTYLGRVEAVNRERRSDQERRAGPLLPLVDQAASGFSGGTFDFTIRDARADDVALAGASAGAITPDRLDMSLVSIMP